MRGRKPSAASAVKALNEAASISTLRAYRSADWEPRPPADARTVARMLSPPLARAMLAIGEGREIGFPPKSPLRFLRLIDEACALTSLGSEVLTILREG